MNQLKYNRTVKMMKGGTTERSAPCPARHRRRGVTLLEVLLYIGLFSILCISIIFLYISISRSAYLIRSSIQRAEFSFFAYEICRYGIDRYGASHQVRDEDFVRVLRYYPNFRMTDVVSRLVSARGGSSVVVQITYTLAVKGANAASEKKFSSSLYINAL